MLYSMYKNPRLINTKHMQKVTDKPNRGLIGEMVYCSKNTIGSDNYFRVDAGYVAEVIDVRHYNKSKYCIKVELRSEDISNYSGWVKPSDFILFKDVRHIFI